MVSPGLLLEGRYRLDSRIAAGGMGEVWRGTDLMLRRWVAVKLLLPEFAWDAEPAARFRAEARHAGMVSHPNIARIFDYSEGGGAGGDDDGSRRPYLVMELVDGPSLAALLTSGPVGTTYTLDVLAQVCAGLAAAHEADLVHRDIKPANLLISSDGLVKITDFGIAHAAGAAPMTRTGVLVGTGAYLAPERASGVQAGPAADLYSLGVVAFVCLTGQRPFTGDPLEVIAAHQTQPLPPLPPDVPEQVAALVADLTAKDPAARPPGAAEVASYVERLRAELGDIGPARPDLPPLAPAVVSTGPQPVPWHGEVTAPPADDDQSRDPTRSAAGLRPAAQAGESGGFPPDEQGGRSGRGGRRTGAGLAVAAAVVLAALGVWAFAGGSGPAQHVRMTSRTHSAVRRNGAPGGHTVSAPPVPAATSAVGTVPAAAPTASQASSSPSRSTGTRTPAPAHSLTHSPTPAPTGSSTPPPTSTPTPTPTPTGTGSPTPTPTGSVSGG
ncbi:MAG TPA: serine/threonine-protein kinase [Streptosporangiaceae bacterium]|jgi:serine/threonine-protein kinase